jgi:hypothetical protein
MPRTDGPYHQRHAWPGYLSRALLPCPRDNILPAVVNFLCSDLIIVSVDLTLTASATTNFQYIGTRGRPSIDQIVHAPYFSCILAEYAGKPLYRHRR